MQFFVLLFILAFSSVPLAHSQTNGSGLSLPRFISLRADRVNMRTGPGGQYPIEWLYRRRSLPVEVIAEYKHWRKIRDWQGTEGWVHRSMLSGRRTIVVTGGLQPLRRNPDTNSVLSARVMEKAVGLVLECEGDWCHLEIGEHRGWMRRGHIWGVYSNEKLK